MRWGVMKVCTACKEPKPLDAFGWRYKGVKKPYQEARCKQCRAKASTESNRRAREAKEMAEYEETPCPCDACWKQDDCKIECLSFRCWSEHGV